MPIAARRAVLLQIPSHHAPATRRRALNVCVRRTTGHAGRRGVSSGYAGTYPLVGGCACARASCPDPVTTPGRPVPGGC
eukprot:864450-Prymnesium_polylepis.1